MEIKPLKLLHAMHGLRHENVLKLFVTHQARIGLVLLDDGEWYGLNRRSCHPDELANKEERTTWARAQGFKVSTVESYVRRIRAARKKEHAAINRERAIDLLLADGYTVTPPAPKRRKKEVDHA